ncbi:succinate dehydrogenase, cytochrome b556 subunit [Derxia gummosa]|uniref:Succinate dehydrogenase cytochrome b556 subunit n=1 Tax=Derxia gummosa DSM 723 TaxID=1121388 RepID=A0A8B6X7W1_9BURK|nr:succinate dehydrogenase, cytochrome b556 subunit [Derxia gummosa]
MAEATTSRQRPEFRNIHVSDISKYRLPLAGRLSILHRITGAMLFLALPVVLLPLFEKSLTSELSFEAYREIASGPIVKLILLVLSWGYLHHMCAGVRYLLLDLHVGIDKESSRKSAAAVFAVSIALTVLVALKIFGVF